MERKPGIDMGGEAGLELFKVHIGRANVAWDNVFKITQWNYIVFSAAFAFSTAGIVGDFIKKSDKFALLMIFILVFVVSSMSALLSYFWCRCAYDYHWHEKQVMKAWLRNKNGRDFIDQKKSDPFSPYAKRSEGVELTKDGLIDLFTNIYFYVNLVPAAVCLILIILLSVR